MKNLHALGKWKLTDLHLMRLGYYRSRGYRVRLLLRPSGTISVQYREWDTWFAAPRDFYGIVSVEIPGYLNRGETELRAGHVAIAPRALASELDITTHEVTRAHR